MTIKTPTQKSLCMQTTPTIRTTQNATTCTVSIKTRSYPSQNPHIYKSRHHEVELKLLTTVHSRLAGTHWISHSKPGRLRLATVSLRDRKTPENKKIWGGKKINHTGRTGELKHQQKLDMLVIMFIMKLQKTSSVSLQWKCDMQI